MVPKKKVLSRVYCINKNIYFTQNPTNCQLKQLFSSRKLQENKADKAAPTGGQSPAEGRHPQNYHQETQETKLCQQEVRPPATEHGQRGGRLCPGGGAQPTGTQHCAGGGGEASGRARGQTGVYPREIRSAACQEKTLDKINSSLDVSTCYFL